MVEGNDTLHSGEILGQRKPELRHFLGNIQEVNQPRFTANREF